MKSSFGPTFVKSLLIFGLMQGYLSTSAAEDGANSGLMGLAKALQNEDSPVAADKSAGKPLEKKIAEPIVTTAAPTRVQPPAVVVSNQAPKELEKEKKKKSLLKQQKKVQVALPSRQAPSPPDRSPASAPNQQALHSESAEPNPDDKSKTKSVYNLFNPTPKDQMRDLNPDRPGTGTSPYTVDAGHIQTEFEFANYSYTHSSANPSSQTSENISTRFNYPSLNLKVGVTNNSDFQIALYPYVLMSSQDKGEDKQTLNGFGDVSLRYKINFIGNEGGPLAFALVPAVKFPTNTGGVGNKTVEYSLQAPFNVSLPRNFSFNFMPELDLSKNQDSDGMHPEFLTSFALGHHLFWIVDSYVEFVSQESSDGGSSWTTSAGTGLIFKIGTDSQLDFGSNFGLSDSAPQWNPSLGWVTRF